SGVTRGRELEYRNLIRPLIDANGGICIYEYEVFYCADDHTGTCVEDQKITFFIGAPIGPMEQPLLRGLVAPSWKIYEAGGNRGRFAAETARPTNPPGRPEPVH